jgi:16S rRNA processing protein RimM
MATAGEFRTAAQPPEYLVVGKIVAPFGIRGEVKVLLDTDFPELFLDAESVYLGEPPTRHQVEWTQLHRGIGLLKVVGCNDRNTAETLREQWVQIPVDAAPVPSEGEYYYHQLIDLQVWTDMGEHLGQIVEILATGGNEVLVVHGMGGEILLPMIEDVVQEVDLPAGRISVHLLEGLRGS